MAMHGNKMKKKGMARGGKMKKGYAKGGKMKKMANGGKVRAMKKKGMANGGKTGMTLSSLRAAAKAKGYKLMKG